MPIRSTSAPYLSRRSPAGTRVIDGGGRVLMPGLPSGALISQTAGHGDFGPAYDRRVAIGGEPSHFEDIGAFTVANGVAQVEAAARKGSAVRSMPACAQSSTVTWLTSRP